MYSGNGGRNMLNSYNNTNNVQDWIIALNQQLSQLNNQVAEKREFLIYLYHQFYALNPTEEAKELDNLAGEYSDIIAEATGKYDKEIAEIEQKLLMNKNASDEFLKQSDVSKVRDNFANAYKSGEIKKMAEQLVSAAKGESNNFDQIREQMKNYVANLNKPLGELDNKLEPYIKERERLLADLNKLEEKSCREAEKAINGQKDFLQAIMREIKETQEKIAEMSDLGSAVHSTIEKVKAEILALNIEIQNRKNELTRLDGQRFNNLPPVPPFYNYSYPGTPNNNSNNNNNNSNNSNNNNNNNRSNRYDG